MVQSLFFLEAVIALASDSSCRSLLFHVPLSPSYVKFDTMSRSPWTFLMHLLLKAWSTLPSLDHILTAWTSTTWWVRVNESLRERHTYWRNYRSKTSIIPESPFLLLFYSSSLVVFLIFRSRNLWLVKTEDLLVVCVVNRTLFSCDLRSKGLLTVVVKVLDSRPILITKVKKVFDFV